MKTNLFKTLALGAALVGSSFVFAEVPANDWNVNDEVVVKESTTHYLTGEEPSAWVYDSIHHVMQVGSKRFENGILLKEAFSWVGPDDITTPDGKAPKGAAKGSEKKSNATDGTDKNAGKHYSLSDWHVGDTIMIKPETKHYLTGEEPSTWVYDREHTIQAIGSKRFPEGILVKGIISWVGPDDIYSPSRQPQEVKPAETKVEETKGQEGTTKPEEVTKPGETTTEEVTTPTDDNNGKVEVKPEDGGDKPGEVEEEPKKEEEPQPAQEARSNRMSKHHRFSIGLRGGVASLMQHAVPMDNWKLGFDGILDLQYAHYFGAKKKVNHGIITGVSVGYAQSPLRKNNLNDTYTVTTDYGDGTSGNVNYTVKTDQIKENDRQIQVEVPLMYSLQTEKGFFFNVGARFMVPAWKHYNQTITNNENTEISAEFTDMGVTVTNEDVTGLLGTEDYNKKGNWAKGQFVFNVMATAELGWEWELKNGHALGLGLYANYAPYNSFKNNTSAQSLINVTAPQGTTPATVDVLSATDTYADKMNYFDGGLKLVYHFQFPVKK